MMADSWCDKLASTPTIGIKMMPDVASGDAIIQALAPIFNKLPVGDNMGFQVEQHSPMAVTIMTDDGFRYAVDHARISVTFNHRLKARQVSGGPPVMEMTSKPLP